MGVGAIRAVTVGVSDVERALGLFRDVMGLQVESDVEAPPELVAAWQLPPDSRVRLVELSCAGYPVGRLRLAQYEPPAEGLVRGDFEGGGDSGTDIGPKAIDFYTHKPVAEAMVELEAAGCRARSHPIYYQVGEIVTEEVVLTGPDGVPMLVMYGHRHPPSSMRMTGSHCTYSEIPTVSVVCGDLAESRRFYGELLGLQVGTDAEISAELRDVVCVLTGVPHGSRIHMLVYQQSDEPSGKYLLVHFFAASKRRLAGRMRPGHLGVSLYTHDVEHLAGIEGRLRQAGIEIISGPVEVNAGRAGRYRVLLARGPNEELFELREWQP